MLKLYSVACISWKTIIEHIIANNTLCTGDIIVNLSFIREAEEACNAEQLPVLKQCFPEYFADKEAASKPTYEDVWDFSNEGCKFWHALHDEYIFLKK